MSGTWAKICLASEILQREYFILDILYFLYFRSLYNFLIIKTWKERTIFKITFEETLENVYFQNIIFLAASSRTWNIHNKIFAFQCEHTRQFRCHCLCEYFTFVWGNLQPVSFACGRKKLNFATIFSSLREWKNEKFCNGVLTKYNNNIKFEKSKQVIM